MAAAVVLAVVLSSSSSPQIAKRSNPKPVCGVYRDDKTVRINNTALQAEVAKTPAQQAVGLTGRPCILANEAMLFEFSRPSHYGFWMKGMKFPIDIVWISADHKVVGLQPNLQPSTYPNRYANNKTLAQYVLELKANRARDLHISFGTPISF